MRYNLTHKNEFFPALNDFFPSLFHDGWTGYETARQEAKFIAPVNVEETETHYLLSLDAPGFRKEDIQVEVDNDVLKIRGERQVSKDDRKKKVHISERSFGRFERAFGFGEGADLEKIEAQFTDGVLHVAIPKKEAVKPRRIDVKVG